MIIYFNLLFFFCDEKYVEWKKKKKLINEIFLFMKLDFNVFSLNIRELES